MNDDNDDYRTDDIFARGEGPKKRNSGRKGKRGELNLAKLFAARFKQPFSRVPMSGAIGSTRAMSEHVREAYVGDIVTPPHFRFCLEVKHGYAEIDLHNVIGHGGNKTLDGFMAQATKDAERIGRSPMVCWKKDRMSWLAFVLPDCLDHGDEIGPVCRCALRYGPWEGVDLESLLTLPDAFWFKSEAER